MVPSASAQLLQLLDPGGLGQAFQSHAISAQCVPSAEKSSHPTHIAPAGRPGRLVGPHLFPGHGQEERVPTVGNTTDGIKFGVDLCRGIADIAVKPSHCTPKRWADCHGQCRAHYSGYVDTDCHVLWQQGQSIEAQGGKVAGPVWLVAQATSAGD